MVSFQDNQSFQPLHHQEVRTINDELAASHAYPSVVLYFRQFQSAMLFKDSALLDRIFRVFDADDDNEIIFSEYLSCMSSISSKATREEKLKCTAGYVQSSSMTVDTCLRTCLQFRSRSTTLTATASSGNILLPTPIVRTASLIYTCIFYYSVGDLTAVLAATLREHKLPITRADIDHVVAATVAEANPRNEGMISLEE